jgi:hypothetical protein
MASSINASTTAGVVTTADTSGVLNIQTAGTTAVTVDASQRVSVGTASPSASYGLLTVAGPGISITPDTSSKFQIGRYSAGAPYSYIKMGSTSSGLKFTDPTDSFDLMTLDSSGNLGIGTTSPNARITVKAAGNSYTNGALALVGSVSGTSYITSAGSSLYFSNNGSTDHMALDSSGNLLVGATSTRTSAKLDVRGETIALGANASFYGTIGYSGATGLLSLAAESGGGINFLSGASERMRIASTGNIFTSGNYTVVYPGSGNTTTGIFLESAGQLCVSRDNTVAGRFNRNSTDGTLISCARQGTEVGTIGVTTSATSYNTSSDYRLKNTIAPMTGALAKVAALKPVTYKWNVDGSDGEGFIAHELAEVCPNAVTGEKDGTQMLPYEITPAVNATYDEDGNELTPLVEAVMGEREVPKYQGIDTSFLVATLTAAIQEQQALITQLQADVAALKGA